MKQRLRQANPFRHHEHRTRTSRAQRLLLAGTTIPNPMADNPRCDGCMRFVCAGVTFRRPSIYLGLKTRPAPRALAFAPSRRCGYASSPPDLRSPTSDAGPVLDSDSSVVWSDKRAYKRRDSQEPQPGRAHTPSERRPPTTRSSVPAERRCPRRCHADAAVGESVALADHRYDPRIADRPNLTPERAQRHRLSTAVTPRQACVDCSSRSTPNPGTTSGTTRLREGTPMTR